MQMRKRCWLGAIILVALTGAGAALGVAVKHEPNFYLLSQEPAGKERKDGWGSCVSAFAQVLQALKDTSKERPPTWHGDLSPFQLNSFLQEYFEQDRDSENVRRLGMSAPGIALEEDEIRLAFRYGSGWFSTVVSYDLKVWLVPKQTNVIAVEISRARAGALPISGQTILHRFMEIAREQNLDVNLYRHEGKPVAIISLQPLQSNPTAVLTTLKVRPGRLLILGKTPEHAQTMPMIKAVNAEGVQ